MRLDDAALGSFGDLATAIGLLGPDGQPNAAWFANPVTGGDAATGHGLRHLMADAGQRVALLDFVDAVLGPPEARNDARGQWVPLFREDDPAVTVSAVVESVGGEVRLGLGLEHTTRGGPPSVATRLHVPLFRFAERGSSFPPDAAPPWLLLGRDGGDIEIGVDATFTTTEPAPGDASLGGVAVSVSVPTLPGASVGFGMTLRDLQLPGAAAPRTFTLNADSADDLQSDVLDLLVGLVRAQADALAPTVPAALRPFAALAGIFGLRDATQSGVPVFPFGELPDNGVAALVSWVEDVLDDSGTRSAWLGHLATLFNGTAVPARSAVEIDLSPLTLTVGVRVETGVGGRPMLVPWVEVALDTRTGAVVRGSVDLLRVDTATRGCVAVPDVRLEAMFGVAAGGSALIAGTDPHVDSVRIGLALDANRQPVFVLTAHNVTVGGPTHAVVDLSTPEAALSAGTAALNGAFNSALQSLGDAGALVARIIGTDPAPSAGAVTIGDLIADPIAAVRGYWSDLVGTPAALSDVLTRIARLVTGPAATLPGGGTRADPWRIELLDPLVVLVWRDGTVVHVELAAEAAVPVLGAYRSTTRLGLTVATFDPTAGQVAYVPGATFTTSLGRADGAPARFEVADLALVADAVAVDLVWSAGSGLRGQLRAPDLAVELGAPTPTSSIGGRFPIPLPSLDTDGRLTWATSEWDELEAALGLLIGRLGTPELDALVRLLGWTGGSAHLRLGALLTGDAAVAVEAWLADLVLDCNRVAEALGPVSALLSGFSLSQPLGSGNRDDPFRCPIAGEPRAPGLRVWLDPGCAARRDRLRLELALLLGTEPPEPEAVASVLRRAGTQLPSIAELMVGRPSLGEGFGLLLDRWAGTDGVVGPPSALPDGVDTVTLEDNSYDELVALGSVGALLPFVAEPPAGAGVVHVGCEASWLADRAAGTAFDFTGTTPAPQALPATGAGPWFVRLPTPAEAAAARPDRGGVGEQAARLSALLAARSAPVVLVGYGAAGAAAVRAAANAPAGSSAVTVGTPWGATAVDSLRAGLGGDALRLLTLLHRPGADPWPEVLLAGEATPLQRLRLLVTRSSAIVSAATAEAMPSAAAEVRPPGMTVSAVFGALDRDNLGRGLGAFVADGIEGRLDVAAAPATAPLALHVALDLPVFELDLGGLLVGLGLAIEIGRVGRSAAGGLDVQLVRGVLVDLRLGVHDGWLVGGPGAGNPAGDLRWMSARVDVPLDGGDGDSELVLHEARGLGIDRERWVVRAGGDGASATVAVPEVRVLLSGVVARVAAASPQLGSLLEAFGLLRAGGLDADGLDRLLHDTAATMRRLATVEPAALATALRALVAGATGAGATVDWTVGPARLSVDLGTGAVSARLQAAEDGLLPLDVTVSSGPTATRCDLALGAIDEHEGGLRVVAATPAASGEAWTLTVEWAGPAGAPTRRIPLYPTLDTGGLLDLAGVAVPALGLKALAAAALDTASDVGRALLEQALAVLGLLPEAATGVRRLRLPLGVIQNPGAWVLGVARAGALQVGPAGVALLDALAPLVVPARGSDAGWPLADGVLVRYADDAGRLRLAVEVDVDVQLGDGKTVTTGLVGGVVLGASSSPAPVLQVGVDVDGRGVQLSLDPTLRISLVRPAPAAPLPLYPEGPGLGDALGAAVQSVLPAVLDELADVGGAPAGLRRDVGTVVRDVGDALLLRESGHFSGTRISEFAANPATALAGRLPTLVGPAATALITALDGGGGLVRRGASPPSGSAVFEFGTARSVVVTLATSPAPSIALRANWELPGVGRVVLDELRLAQAGVTVVGRLGPMPIDVGPFDLRPLVAFRAGSAAGSDRLVALGLGLDNAALQAVELRWPLDATPPRLYAVTRNTSGATVSAVEDDAPVWLLSVAASIAMGVASEALGSSLTARTIRMLRGVLFAEGATTPDIDPTLADDLLEPAQLLARLERLLWNAATDSEPLSLTLDGVATLAIAHDGDGTTEQLGIRLTIPDGRRIAIGDADTKVELEVDATWVDPAVAPGLSVFVVRGVRSLGTPDTFAFSFVPAVTVAGVGVRFTTTSGPLLELGPVSLDGIAMHVYAQASASAVGGGVQLELAGLAFAPAAGGGTNAVANAIMSDAGRSSPSTRPAFSPAIAVQKHPPDTGPKVSLRAGPPPGPWWVVVQRQLGPLYLERVGFDTGETAGRVSRVTLLFDGRVEIFGLTAAVDQLSLTWLGGDVLDIRQWSVDLQGLAVSADLAGAVLAGGMLKTTDNGVISYVGMLLGRFGIYGLTVFGGYTNDAGNPSFFVFGAVNGPIGGPPAFFVTGLGGGLGINRRLVIPSDPREFPTYPFIRALDPYASVPEPMSELRRLNAYFGPERGSFWFAAGISFTSFSLVDGIAVLAVSFGNGLEINLMGLARMALPNPAAPLVSIELGLLARFSTNEGVFMIRAALTENSWLLYSDVRLTGGFAFVVWWKGPLAGQFVLTIGGYHPDFRREGYPDVPRVGLTWQVTDDISIKGGAYFALTSEALMAGVGVEAVADFGWAWARARFGADGLVYFDPFWFDVEVRATISAGVEIDTWLGTVSFSITTGTAVHVWGPDFSGTATVQVGPCSVTVPFGSRARREGVVQEWPGFVAKYLEEAAAGRARALSSITGRGSVPAATGGGRSAPPPDGSAARPFEVFAEFELSVATTVPTSRFEIGAPVVVPVRRSDGAATALGLKPMKAGALSSTLRLRLERLNQATRTWQDDAADLAQLAANAVSPQPRPEGTRVATGAFPIGVWGTADPPGTQAPALPSGDVLETGNQVTLVAEATSFARGPEIDYYRVEAGRRPLPLQATGNQRSAIVTAAGGVELPRVSSAAQALAAAQTRLFAPPPARVPEGVLPRGARSNLARATYAGDVAAPPLFGTLTDGLATANADDAGHDEQPPPEPAPAPDPRQPRVAAYLTSGTKVAGRAAATTVSDARIQRRPAPTLDSVHARLRRHLPVQLDVTRMPGGEVDGTFTPRALPRTAQPGAARSYGLGEGPATSRIAGLSGLGGPQPSSRREARAAGVAQASRDGASMASGDLVVLHAPDHAVDVGDVRPRLRLGGAARVTALRGDAVVLLDEAAAEELEIPAGAAFVAVHADGAVDPDDGFAGWHTRSRVAALGSGAALGAGCVLAIDSGLSGPITAWTTPGELLRDAAAVLTRFSSPVTSIAVVVEAAEAQRFGDLEFELVGAQRRLDAVGRPLEPALLVNGPQTVAVYEVVPDAAAAGVSVRITSGGQWQPTGVLGARATVAAMTAALSRGVSSATGRLLAVDGAGCRPEWIPPRPQRTPPKKTTAKKTTAKKTTAKKTTAKKQPSKSARGGGRGR